MQLHFFGILFFVVILNVQCMEITQEDSKWLQTTDDIKHLSEVFVCISNYILLECTP